MQTIYFDNKNPDLNHATDRCKHIKQNDTTILLRGSVFNLDLDSVDFDLNTPEDNIEFYRSIRGDYSIIIDCPEYTIFGTDVMARRDLHFYLNTESRHLIIGTLRDRVMKGSSAGAWQCKFNKIYVVHKHNYEIEILQNRTWCLKQHVNNYDRVYETFEQAVLNRFTDKNDKLMLSAGADSGAIAHVLGSNGKRRFALMQYKIESLTSGPAGSHPGKKLIKDEIEIMLKRMDRHKGQFLPGIRHEEIGNDLHQMLKHDNINIYFLYDPVHQFAYYIKKACANSVGVLTGEFADRIFADCGKQFQKGMWRSFFGGYFPENLQIVFPWYTDLLWTCDLPFNYYDQERRLPFTDDELVQAFLNTTVELKNRDSNGKDWIKQYMKENKIDYFDSMQMKPILF
jgi:asparagine synthetase B (glutamine-hydrolysing)